MNWVLAGSTDGLSKLQLWIFDNEKMCYQALMSQSPLHITMEMEENVTIQPMNVNNGCEKKIFFIFHIWW